MSSTQPQPEFIVLDANVFVADYWLRSPSFVLLRAFLSKTRAKLFVPEVVLQEVTNHHREALDRVKSEIQKTHREAIRLIHSFQASADSLATMDRKNAERPYEQFLRTELGRLGAQIIEYQGIPHGDIVARDLRRRRPFQQSGKGYRDTLLWESLLRHCLKKGLLIVFVTNNLRDFCDPAGNLHPDLRSDLLHRIQTDRDFRLYRELSEFTDTHVVPFLKTRKDFATLVENKKVPGLDLEDVCEQNISVIIRAIEESPDCMIDDPGFYEPAVAVIHIPKDIEVLEASEVSGDVLLVVLKYQVEVAFTYFLPRNDYYSMSEEESKRVSIIDYEWNESVMRVESTRPVDLTCRLTFNTSSQAVESFEVEQVAGAWDEQ